MPAPGHTRGARGLPESYSPLLTQVIVHASVCVCLIRFLIEANITRFEYVKISPANAALKFLHHILTEHFGCGKKAWLNTYARKMPPVSPDNAELESYYLSSRLGFT